MQFPIKACGRCGAQDLQFRTWWGPYTCTRCRWRGTPLEFADRESWEAFVVACQTPRGA
ncbi:MAG: hypothetical protein LC623_09450 [Halobacteriales archaeon]|nr:hypothetical protein [Halobacteriales archaeon]